MKAYLLPLAVVLLGAAAPEGQVDLYKEGQQLFAEKKFEAALDRFQQVDVIVPREPQVYSWIGASLNELGRHAEAKERLQSAIDLLKEDQQAAIKESKPAPSIAVGYYTLLARIQQNLGEFEQAAETINSYPFEDNGSEGATKTKQALESARLALKAKIVSAGMACLESGDLDCARMLFTKADAVLAETRSTRHAVARELLNRADKAPAATDEEKAKRLGHYAMTVQASRLWLEEAGPGSAEAQRVLAKALSGTRTKEGYEEAIAILKALWDDPASEEKDSSIQLDLSVAHAGLEQWDVSIASASAFIALEPEDTLGQGYCLKSFGEFRLGRCPQAITDGQRCKNADGSPRSLDHVQICQNRLAEQAADRAAAVAADLARRCAHLYDRVVWARSYLDDVPLGQFVTLLQDYRAAESECAAHLDAAERKAAKQPFTSPVPAMCAAGAKTASRPLNLSQMSKAEIEALRTQTKEFLALCRSSFSASQIASVEGGLLKVEQAIH